ncbi:MAG: hypothetical protein Q8R82_12715 [Hyphomonadaceae bacterium]|nr:hypothetical protein [Hyphomonadaceae bacterium]
MVRVAAFTAALALAGAAQAAPTQFDLICAGTLETMEKTEPYSTRYRIDTAAGRFCRDACDSAGKIQQTTADMITFTKEIDDAAGRTRLHYISRHTGDLVDTTIDQRLRFMSNAKGSCKPAPFSGFPKAKF